MVVGAVCRVVFSTRITLEMQSETAEAVHPEAAERSSLYLPGERAHHYLPFPVPRLARIRGARKG
jgi:hypothetical protein